MNIEELKKLEVSEDAAKNIIAMFEDAVSAERKKLSDKEAELEMAAEKIQELSEENSMLSEKISVLEQEKDKLAEDSSRTVNMGLKHGAAASGEQFGFRFTGIRSRKKS